MIAAAAFFAIPVWGSLGWLIAMLAGTSVLCLLYIVRGARMVANLGVALAASSLPLALLVYVACR